MRNVPQSLTDAWNSEDKTGPRKPIVRAIVNNVRLIKVPYETGKKRGFFSTIIFGDNSGGTEIRNIKSYSWSRSVNGDVAECTMTIKNVDIMPIGNETEVQNDTDFDQPGTMSPTRGYNMLGPMNEPNPWGYVQQTGWEGRLVPDRLVKTYEGYGIDLGVYNPADDVNLVQTGTWLIDEVTLNSQGDIEVKMRDVGRLLIDQIVFPPVVPYQHYPLEFKTIRTINVPARIVKNGTWTKLTQKLASAKSSNDYYVGKGLSDPPYRNYVGPGGSVNGHYEMHALEGKDGTYWQSTGQTSPSSFVWWQANLKKSVSLNAMRVDVKGGPYRVYISLHRPDGWIGSKKIPYKVTTEDIDLEADIPFVYSEVAERGEQLEAVFKRAYRNVDKVRITFTRLDDTEVGNYPFRAMLQDISIYQGASATNAPKFGKGTKPKPVGDYRDYTDVVKWACAWGGFFWPPHATGLDFVKIRDEKRYITYDNPDSALPRGRVWGDFMNSGTAGQAPGGDLTVDLFDKQPLMNIINYVRDILGFVFFIDETGGVVWRMPNWEHIGNYVSPTRMGVGTRTRTSEVIELSDDTVLLDYSTTYNGKNQRERVFVADTNTSKRGVVIKGFTAYDVGFRRVAGWTDQHFETKQETRVMADMIAARQMFDYRRSRARIAGNPAIQIDDQVRIFERVTNETFYHYVESISCELNMETGAYTYDLETHWLGEDPDGAWVVKREILGDVTRRYLDEVNG